MEKLLIILGPSATGKTDLALYLAKKFNGEIVSCDSRQVYKGLDIGTGKLSGSGKWEVRRGKGFWEIDGVKIWMYDVVSPRVQYTVFDYVKDAIRVVGEVMERGKLPIIVGGSGLYLKALLEGLPNLAIPLDKTLRKKFQRLSKEKLQEKLKKVSSRKWDNLNDSDRENPRRLIRAIELAMSKQIATSVATLLPRNDVLRIGLTAPRDVLYKRVDERVVDRIKEGMVDEAKSLHKTGLSFKRMRELGLEYGVLADYLEGKIQNEGNPLSFGNEEELIKLMQNKIHGFVRRQLTWFKREKDVVWFDITFSGFPGNMEKLVAKWYHQADVTTKD